MNYEYTCAKCENLWEETTSISTRDLPTTEPCPKCKEGGEITRVVAAPAINYDGAYTLHQRAGSRFNEILKNIKSNHPERAKDGTKQTINVR
jgi:putative FmdB family regulatory protein